MLTIQWKGVDKLLADLRKAKATAVPYAVKTALNTQAFEARRIWQREIRGEFTLRNQFTERSILAVKASGKGENIQSSVGSVAPYMLQQELGGTVHGKSGLKGIPGPSAAGLPAGTKRTRLVRSANYLGTLHALKTPHGGSKKRRNAIAIAMAVRQGKQVVLLERPKGGKGLFRVTGGQQRFSSRRRAFTRRALKLRLLWDFSKSSVHVPPAPTLQRTLHALEPKLPSMWQAAIVDQFRRHHIFGY
jgi:hypothetical protein